MADDPGVLMNPDGKGALKLLLDQPGMHGMPGRQVFAPSGGGHGGLEQVVRPFGVADSRIPPPPRPDAPPLPGEDREASITWGATSSFTIPDHPVEDADADGGMTEDPAPPDQPQPKPPNNTSKPRTRRRPKPQDKKKGVKAFEMMDMITEKGKVYNPEDREQWVEVLRIKSIRFRGPDGEIFKFNMKWPPFPSPPPE